MSSAAAAVNELIGSSLHSNVEENTLEETRRPAHLHVSYLKRNGIATSEANFVEAPSFFSVVPGSAEERPEPVVVEKPFSFTHNRFVPLQKWEGVVLRINQEAFTARLVDLTTKGTDEEAEFSLEEVPGSDLNLLSEGAVFYWDIGYLDQTNGQRIRASSLRFRRLPSWKAIELRDAEQRAKQLEALFGNE